MQPFSFFFFFFVIRCGAGGRDFGSGSGFKFNCAARVGSGQTISGTGRVRASVLSPCRPLVHARGLAFTARAHTSLFLSLSPHLRSFCSARGREEQSLIQLNRYYAACFSNFTCKYSQNHSTAIVIILWVFYLIRQRLDYQVFCAD